MQTIIDKPLLQNLRNEMNIALADVASRHGVTINVGSCSYNATTATFKIEVVALGESGEKRDMPAELFLQNAAFIGLKAEHLGKLITLQGRPFTVAGYKPKARKNCIVIKDTAGKTFVTSIESVKRQLDKA